jgi:hypothetical protein
MDDRSPSSLIWSEKHQIDHARSQKLHEAMEEYDRNVYLPAKRDLQARCAAIGHVPQSKYHFGPTGASWQYCNQCGARLNFEPSRSADTPGPEVPK